MVPPFRGSRAAWAGLAVATAAVLAAPGAAGAAAASGGRSDALHPGVPGGGLEAQAATRRVRTVRLEASRALTEAIGRYRSAGYREVPAFTDEARAHHWFVKDLG